MVRMSHDIVSEVYADYRAWYEIRFALFSVFKCFADAARMTAKYGERKYDPNAYRDG